MRRHPKVENHAYGDMMRRMIRALERRVIAGDVEDLGLMVELQKMLEDAMGSAARGLNDQGESWARIARGAGFASRQAAQQRWGKP